MDFAKLVRALLRRWLILVIGIVISGGAAYAVYRYTPRTYEGTSQVMLLLPPTGGSADVTISPFLNLPAGLSTLARVLTLPPATPEYRASMAASGFDATYSLSVQPQNPIVTFTVEDRDPVRVLRTRDELMRRFAADLDEIQTTEKVPRRQWAHVRVLVSSNEVTSRSGDGFRNAAGVGVAGALLTLMVVVLLERRSSSTPRAVTAEDSEPENVDGEKLRRARPESNGRLAEEGSLSK